MSCAVALILFTYALNLPANAQNNAPNTEIALSINDSYPIFKRENLTRTTSHQCICQFNNSIPEPQWSNWIGCHGQSGSYDCHNGFQSHERPCSTSSMCVQREWRYCYHERTCNGTWIEWKDGNSECNSRTGVRVRTYICRRDDKIGSFCAGNQRSPYKVEINPCRSYAITGDQTTIEKALEPNLTTWIATGLGGVFVIFAIVLLLCVNRCREIDSPGSKHLNESECSSPKRDSIKSTKKDSQIFITESRSEKIEPAPQDIFPEPPPVLRHSFFENCPVPSETQVYALPTNKPSPLANYPVQNLQPNAHKPLESYVESNMPFQKEKLSGIEEHRLLAPISDQHLDNAESNRAFSGNTIVTKNTLQAFQNSDLSVNTQNTSSVRSSHIYDEICQKPTNAQIINHPDDFMAATASIKM